MSILVELVCIRINNICNELQLSHNAEKLILVMTKNNLSSIKAFTKRWFMVKVHNLLLRNLYFLEYGE